MSRTSSSLVCHRALGLVIVATALGGGRASAQDMDCATWPGVSAAVDAAASNTAAAPFVPHRLLVRFEPLPDAAAARPILPEVDALRPLLPPSRKRPADSAQDGPHHVFIATLSPGVDVLAAAPRNAAIPGGRYPQPA